MQKALERKVFIHFFPPDGIAEAVYLPSGTLFGCRRKQAGIPVNRVTDEMTGIRVDADVRGRERDVSNSHGSTIILDQNILSSAESKALCSLR